MFTVLYDMYRSGGFCWVNRTNLMDVRFEENPHRNLPEEMRKVEYVSFVSKGIEVKNTKEDDKEVIDYKPNRAREN